MKTKLNKEINMNYLTIKGYKVMVENDKRIYYISKQERKVISYNKLKDTMKFLSTKVSHKSNGFARKHNFRINVKINNKIKVLYIDEETFEYNQAKTINKEKTQQLGTVTLEKSIIEYLKTKDNKSFYINELIKADLKNEH